MEKESKMEVMIIVLRDGKIATYKSSEYTDFNTGEDFFTIYDDKKVVAMYAKDYVLAVEFDYE